MFKLSIASAAAIVLTAGVGLSGPAWAVNDKPFSENWAPSEWGKDDKAGSVNRTTAAMVLKAAKLIKRGKVATLGKVYAQDAPAFGSRGWRMTIPGLPTGGPFGK
ncbi:MAG: cyclase family protein, partial [Alphaproteobacteria bacterium]|nr:cyclase family protein [Alphaproteobacteria bacterium]